MFAISSTSAWSMRRGVRACLKSLGNDCKRFWIIQTADILTPTSLTLQALRKPRMDALASLRVVLVHDWLTGMRGGEKVLESLCQRWPDAPLYTLIHKRGSVSKAIENRPIV